MRCSVCKKVLPEGRKLRRCKKCQRSYSKKYMQQRRSKFRDQESQSSSIEPETPDKVRETVRKSKEILESMKANWAREKEERERSREKPSIERDSRSYEPSYETEDEPEFQSSQNPMDLDWTRPLWDCSEDEFPRITEEMGIRDSSDWRTARVRAIYKERF